MKTGFYFLPLTLVTAASCNTGSGDTAALKADVADLKTRIATLEAQLATLQPQVVANSAAVAGGAEAITWAQSLQPYMALNDENDVVVAGANLRIQDVAGTTPAASPNGKGNLIVGFDDDRMEGTCVGGANDGLACDPEVASQCPAGSCGSVAVVSQKTGSHNIIVGRRHSYPGEHSLLVGDANTANADGAFAAGALNTVSVSGGSILGGAGNAVDASASWGAVCGGLKNAAVGPYSSVLGGETNTAGGSYSVVVGGQSNTAVGPYAIVP